MALAKAPAGPVECNQSLERVGSGLQGDDTSPTLIPMRCPSAGFHGRRPKPADELGIRVAPGP